MVRIFFCFPQLQTIYGDHFPLEARHHLAGWLEASFVGVEELEVGAGSNPVHEEHARVLVISLVQQLEQKAAETSDFLTKNKLEQIIENFKVSELISSICTKSLTCRFSRNACYKVLKHFFDI